MKELDQTTNAEHVIKLKQHINSLKTIINKNYGREYESWKRSTTPSYGIYNYI